MGLVWLSAFGWLNTETNFHRCLFSSCSSWKSNWHEFCHTLTDREQLYIAPEACAQSETLLSIVCVCIVVNLAVPISPQLQSTIKKPKGPRTCPLERHGFWIGLYVAWVIMRSHSTCNTGNIWQHTGNICIPLYTHSDTAQIHSQIHSHSKTNTPMIISSQVVMICNMNVPSREDFSTWDERVKMKWNISASHDVYQQIFIP